MFSFLPYVFALLVVLLVRSIWKRSRNPFGLPQATFLWPLPIHFAMTARSNENLSTTIAKYREKYGDVFVFPMLGVPMVVLAGDDALLWATKQEKDDHFKRSFPRNIDRLLGSKRVDVHQKSYWKKNRELLSPILMKSNTLNNFAPIMETAILQHLSKISQLDAKTLAPIVFDIAWLFGVGKRGIQYKEKIAEAYSNIKGAMAAFPLNFPGGALRKGLDARTVISKTVIEIIENDPTAATDPDCCISTVASSFSTEIEQKMLGLLFASHETTYRALSGLIWSLVNNPSILEKLQSEIRDSQNHPTTVGDFQNYPYLNKVIHETLRIYGADFIFREAKENISYQNKVFPKGTKFMLAVGYDHQQVKDALNFDPEREDKYKWEPFGMGPRNCLGKIFALLEMKMIMYHLLKNYNVKPEKDANASIYSYSQVQLQNARLLISSPSA